MILLSNVGKPGGANSAVLVESPIKAKTRGGDPLPGVGWITAAKITATRIDHRTITPGCTDSTLGPAKAFVTICMALRRPNFSRRSDVASGTGPFFAGR